MKFKYEYENKMRIDQFLSQEIDFLSREKVKNHIKKGFVLVNKKVILKSKQIVSIGDKIEIKILKEKINESITPWKEGIMPEIIYETNDYLIINKPSGLVVHPGTGNINNTLVNILIKENLNLSKKDSQRPGIVHRIDKKTSGLMIICKNDKFHDFIAKKFTNGEIIKKYELITDGRYKSSKGIIDVPIGRDKYNRKLMSATLENSKPAKSIFRIIKSFKNNEYVEYKILTGRTHQIRVHSKFVGAPILNDPEYGKKTFDINFGQYLHAKKISFTDISGEEKMFSCELPIEMIEKLEELKEIK